MLAGDAPRRHHHRLAHEEPRLAAGGIAGRSSPTSSRVEAGARRAARRAGRALRLSRRSVHAAGRRRGRSAPATGSATPPARTAIRGIPTLTIERLLLWEGSSVDGDGQFSPAILNCQVQDLWPPARTCDRIHVPEGRRRAWIAPRARRSCWSSAAASAWRRRSRSASCCARAVRPGGVRHLQAVLPPLRDALRRAAARHGREPLLLRAAAVGARRPLRRQRGRRCSTAAGLLGIGVLYAGAHGRSARWLTPELAGYVVPLGLFLTFTLASTVLEIVMVSRKQHMTAAVTYALSDIVPHARCSSSRRCCSPRFARCSSAPSVFAGAAAGRDARGAVARVRPRLPRRPRRCWRQQLGYALPFALAVGIEVVLINYHQYVVAGRFDAATFAIYAVGCLQIPLVRSDRARPP